MSLDPESSNSRLMTSVTVVALVIFVLRLAFPDLQIDAVALGLLLLAFLPWLSPLVKSAELPGGFKIEFQDVKEAAEKIVLATATRGTLTVSEPRATYQAIAEQDPNLALVGLRIEIEKRLRALADQAGVPGKRSLLQLTTELQAQGVLEPQASSGLRDLISLGNQAAHGAPVSTDVALSAADYGPLVLESLDAKLIQGSTGRDESRARPE